MVPNSTDKKKKSNKMLWWISGGIVLVIILLIILSKAGVLGKNDLSEVQTEKIEKRTIKEIISASGKLKPEKEVSISSDVSGEIIELLVKEGDRVSKGDLLVRIKPDEYQSSLDDADAAYNTAIANFKTAKSNLNQTEAMFNKAKATYERYQVLKEKKAVSDTEFERVESEYLSAKAQLEAAKQNVIGAEFAVKSANARKQRAYDNLRKTSIFSPVDGTVTKLNSQLGERVVGTIQMMGTVIMKIADLNKMVVDIDVNENDIIRISFNDTTNIEVDAFPDRIFKGLVTEIANSCKESTSTLSDQVTTFSVKIRILEESYKDIISASGTVTTPFRPGMSALVDINTDVVQNVISAPILAVTTRDKAKKTDEGKKEGKKTDENSTNEDNEKEKSGKNTRQVVFVYKNGVVTMVEVETGIQDDTYIQIKKGLNEGDEVVSGPYSIISKTLKDGQKVKKAAREKTK
jgi:HlyD family secretion protein